MTMRGMAFLPIWHDVDSGMEPEFNRWHTGEHMPERVHTPGIVVGRRYADAAAPLHRYFTLYEALSFDVFASEGYFVTANARSEWTTRVHPAFQNFLRSPCHLVMTRGRGIGGAMATVRISFPQPGASPRGDGAPSAKDAYTLAVRALVEAIIAMDLVTAVHAGVCAPVARAPLSSESLSLRPNAKSFDGVLMIESIDRGALQAMMPGVEALLEALPDAIASYQVGIYELAYLISSPDSHG